MDGIQLERWRNYFDSFYLRFAKMKQMRVGY